MAAIKIHVYRTEMGDQGTQQCDYRAGGEQGAGENDQHRTFLEIDPASEELIERVLLIGPSLNDMFMGMVEAEPSFFGDVATLLGLEGTGPVGLRLGVWAQ